jgi:NADPH2:quinone reductase
VTLLQPPADTDWSVARQRNLRIGLELMLTPAQLGLREALAAQARILEDCAALFDAGTLRVELVEVLPLADAAEAHRRLEAGGLQGKLVLAIG